jgi:hypothetical protein
MRPSPLTFNRIDLWAIALACDKHFVGSLEKVTPHHRLRWPVTPEPSGTTNQPAHGSITTAGVEGPE